MSVIKLEASKKPDLVISYLDNEYILPGNVSADFVEVMVNAQDSDEELTKAFLADIIPADFKKVLAASDIAPLVRIWADYVNAPKESASAESSETTNQN